MEKILSSAYDKEHTSHCFCTHVITHLEWIERHIPFTTGMEVVQTLDAISNPSACFVDKPETYHLMKV